MKYLSTATVCVSIAFVCMMLYVLFPGAWTMALFFYVVAPMLLIPLGICCYNVWKYLSRGYTESI